MILVGLKTVANMEVFPVLTAEQFENALLNTDIPNMCALGCSVPGEPTLVRVDKSTHLPLVWNAWGMDFDRGTGEKGDKKTPWPDDATRDAVTDEIALRASLAAKSSGNIHKTITYATKNGARTWYFFIKPVPQLDFEFTTHRIASFLEVGDLGVHMDDTHHQWHRLQRVKLAGMPHIIHEIVPQPIAPTCTREMRDWLRKYEFGYLPQVIARRPLGAPGKRDEAIFKAVSQLLQILDKPNAPTSGMALDEAVFALLAPSVSNDTTPDAPTLANLTEKIQRQYQRHTEKKTKQAPDAEDMPLLISYARGVFVRSQKGAYNLFDQAQLPTVLEREYPQFVTRKPQGNRKSATDMLEDTGSHYAINVKYTYTEPTKLEETTLRINLIDIPPSTPVYDEQIAQFLELMGGGPGNTVVAQWLSLCLEFHRPLPALFIQGVRGTGKSFLALSLLPSLIGATSTMTFDRVLERFNDDLTFRPFLSIDEGQVSGNHSSKKLRSLLGNSVHQVERKFGGVFEVHGCPRLIIAANNPHAIDIQEDLREEDLDALSLRVILRRADNSSADFLCGISKERRAEWVKYRFRDHVHWLRENSPWLEEARAHSERFLMHDPTNAYASVLRLLSPSTRNVFGATLDSIFNTRKTTMHAYFCHLGRDTVMVSPEQVQKDWHPEAWGRVPTKAAVNTKLQDNCVALRRTTACRGVLISYDILEKAAECCGIYPDITQRLADLKKRKEKVNELGNESA